MFQLLYSPDFFSYVFTQHLCNAQDVTQGQFLSGVQLVLLQFSFSETDCLTKAKELSLPDYLCINRGRFDAFPKGISAK